MSLGHEPGRGEEVSREIILAYLHLGLMDDPSRFSDGKNV